MRVSRHFTTAGKDAFASVAFKRVAVDPEQCCVADVEVPAHWSFEATQLFAKHFLTRELVPARLMKQEEAGVPQFLQRSVADHAALSAVPNKKRMVQESSARDVFKRLAGSWTYHGFKAGYFDTPDDALAFFDECCAILALQKAAPNSLQWRQNGIYWAYGIEGEASAGFVKDVQTGKLAKAGHAYTHPQLHACVINSVKHNSTSEDALLALIERERRAMSLGISSGCHFADAKKPGSLMRAVSLRDKAVHTIAQQGVPRKPAAMAVIDTEHSECEAFMRFVVEEHYKAAAMMLGARVLRKHLMQILVAVQAGKGAADACEPTRNAMLKSAIMQARQALVPQVAIERVLSYARAGFTDLHIPVYNAELGSEVFNSMAAYHSKLAICISDAQMKAWQASGSEMLDNWAHGAWAAGEPALMFADAIADWHGCASVGKVQATTAGMEFLFLDDTALPLAAINLAAFSQKSGSIDVAGLKHTVKLITIMLDITVGMAQYATRDIAQQSADTRPLGLSITGLAELLMAQGLAYDSEIARQTAAALTGIVTAEAYATSAAMAKDTGAFTHFATSRVAMMKLLKTHRDLATGKVVKTASGREVAGIVIAQPLAQELQRSWDQALMWAEAYGLRNAQVSCVAPMTTMTRLMDTATTGVAPTQKLVLCAPQPNGKARKYVHPMVENGLRQLGYGTSQIADIAKFLTGTGVLAEKGEISKDSLREHGFGKEQFAAIEAALGSAGSIEEAFDAWVLGEKFCRAVLKLSDNELFNEGFSLLKHLGFNKRAILDADIKACGSKTMCGAPHLKPQHLAVFACLKPQSLASEREVSAEAQIRMMAALQPFVSGGVSHNVTLAFDAQIIEPVALANLAFELGLKTLSITRHACQLYTTQMPELQQDEELAQDALYMIGGLMRQVV